MIGLQRASERSGDKGGHGQQHWRARTGSGLGLGVGRYSELAGGLLADGSRTEGPERRGQEF